MGTIKIGHIDELDSIYQELLDLIPINEVNFDIEPDEDGIRHIRRFLDDCDERILSNLIFQIHIYLR